MPAGLAAQRPGMDTNLLVQAGSLVLGELFHLSPGHAAQVSGAISSLANATHSGNESATTTAANTLQTAITVAATAFPQNEAIAKAGAIAGVVSAYPQTISEYDQGDAVKFPLTPTIRGHKAIILIMREDGRGAQAYYGSNS